MTGAISLIISTYPHVGVRSETSHLFYMEQLTLDTTNVQQFFLHTAVLTFSKMTWLDKIHLLTQKRT